MGADLRPELQPVAVVPLPVRCLPVEPPTPGTRVLARVILDGYTSVIVGRESDRPATLEWLDARRSKTPET
ncbi:hypothetical protein DAERI_010067 [Deinococcus aerius]|uniref:Uncharacterized protein n=1 Tax=Deinococcus aerius TaxID=200253 RepID=A0A2I9DUA4_9DEIO|nr:hypothetical protein DAERI_010067 [Deinococcus aerius]